MDSVLIIWFCCLNIYIFVNSAVDKFIRLTFRTYSFIGCEFKRKERVIGKMVYSYSHPISMHIASGGGDPKTTENIFIVYYVDGLSLSLIFSVDSYHENGNFKLYCKYIDGCDRSGGEYATQTMILKIKIGSIGRRKIHGPIEITSNARREY